MPSYTCRRCMYTSNALDVIRHLGRKTTCTPTSPEGDIDRSVLLTELLRSREKPPKKCPTCGVTFTSNYNLHRHEQSCKRTTSEVDSANAMTIMEQTIQMLERRLLAVESRPVHQTVNVIVINNFGKEDTSYITPEVLHERLLNRNEGVIKTIEDIHFHPEHPENKNVRIRSIKQGTAEIRADDVWQIALLKDVANRLLEKSFGMLMTHVVDDMASMDELMEKHADVFEWQMRFRTREAKRFLVDRAAMLIINKTRKN